MTTNKTAIDERLQKALEFSNFRSTLNRQLKNAKSKFDNALTYSENGGIFKVNPALISFVQALISQDMESTIMLDDNSRPIEIENLPALLEKITDLYFSSLNDYLIECNNLKKSKRTVSAILEV